MFTLTGTDRPGVTAALLSALAQPGVQVLDMEQVVVRGQLTLGVLAAPGTEHGDSADEPSAGQALLDAPRHHDEPASQHGTELTRTRGSQHPAPAASMGTVASLRTAAQACADTLQMELRVRVGHGDSRSRRAGRASVTVLAESLDAGSMHQVAGLIGAHGANIDRIRRLSRYPVTTVEFEVSGAEVDLLRRELVTFSHDSGLDLAVSPAGLARRGRRLLVMDVDSTLIQDEVIELLAAHAGREADVAAVTEAAMRGELDFAASLHERVATLAGLDVAVLDQVRAAVRLTPGAARLCRTLRRLGCTIGVVSGGFAEVVEPLAADLGITHVRANRLEVVDGRLTGRVRGPVIDRAAKAVALQEFAAAEHLPLSRTVAVGDGANDLDMLAIAGLGVAFNAKPLVRQQASAALNVPYLDAVLYLLGISSDEVDEADATD
ncbi:MAG: phosphoserine phosphatase SerB [Actinomycetales bacterium]